MVVLPPDFDPDSAARDVFVLADDHPAMQVDWHAHARAQLIHASAGVLTVEAETGLWVVPPQRAVWVPPGMRHRLSSKGSFSLRTLYAVPGTPGLPQTAHVVAVDTLANELLIAASAYGPDYPKDGPEARLIRVILDHLPGLETAPLHLPNPTDPRLARICDTLRADPASEATLAELAAAAGMTERTAARLFHRDCGTRFGEWRQQLRLLVALEALARGTPVTTVAFDVGYRDPSSFIAVFRKAMGTTPAQFFRA